MYRHSNNKRCSLQLQLDNEFPLYHALRTARTKERGPQICGNLPEAKAAARELCQELCGMCRICLRKRDVNIASEYLSRRYPTLYHVTRKANHLGWGGEGEINWISMPEFGVSYDLEKQDPLEVRQSSTRRAHLSRPIRCRSPGSSNPLT